MKKIHQKKNIPDGKSQTVLKRILAKKRSCIRNTPIYVQILNNLNTDHNIRPITDSFWLPANTKQLPNRVLNTNQFLIHLPVYKGHTFIGTRQVTRDPGERTHQLIQCSHLVAYPSAASRECVQVGPNGCAFRVIPMKKKGQIKSLHYIIIYSYFISNI